MLKTVELLGICRIYNLFGKKRPTARCRPSEPPRPRIILMVGDTRMRDWLLVLVPLTLAISQIFYSREILRNDLLGGEPDPVRLEIRAC